VKKEPRSKGAPALFRKGVRRGRKGGDIAVKAASIGKLIKKQRLSKTTGRLPKDHSGNV